MSKSDAAGRLRSLKMLLDEHPAAAPGVVVSTAPYGELPEQDLVFVPLYAVGPAARLGLNG